MAPPSNSLSLSFLTLMLSLSGHVARSPPPPLHLGGYQGTGAVAPGYELGHSHDYCRQRKKKREKKTRRRAHPSHSRPGDRNQHLNWEDWDWVQQCNKRDGKGSKKKEQENPHTTMTFDGARSCRQPQANVGACIFLSSSISASVSVCCLLAPPPFSKSRCLSMSSAFRGFGYRLLDTDRVSLHNQSMLPRRFWRPGRLANGGQQLHPLPPGHPIATLQELSPSA